MKREGTRTSSVPVVSREAIQASSDSGIQPKPTRSSRSTTNLEQIDHEPRAANTTLAATKRSSPPGCSLAGFVDDHICLGHPQATAELTSRLSSKIAYPASAFQEVGVRSLQDLVKEIAHVVGLDIVIEAGSPLCLSVIFSQKSYGCMWVGRFRDHLKQATGSDKLRAQQTPGHAPSRMRAPPP